MIKALINLILFLSSSLTTHIVFGQQDPTFAQIIYNTSSLNPAYAGSEEHWSLIALHRSQWVGVDGSPTTQSLSIQGPTGNSLGIGFNLANDAIGPANEIVFNSDFAYKLKVSRDEKFFALGLKAGGRIFDVDFTKGITLGQDRVFQNNIKNQFFPTVGVGMFYYSEKSYFGISIPNLFSQDFYDESEQEIDTERVQFLFTIGTVFNLNKELRLKPAVFTKWLPDEEFILDFSLSGMIKENLTIGLSYRYDNAISVLANLKISPRFHVGYAYDKTTENLRNYNFGTHEIFLRFAFKSEKQTFNNQRFF